jgi:hypothetical protein
MLGRAAAEQQCDAQSFRHVVVSRIGSLVRTSPKGVVGSTGADGARRPGRKGRVGGDTSCDAERRRGAVRACGSASSTADWPPTAWIGSMGCDTPLLERTAIRRITYAKPV